MAHALVAGTTAKGESIVMLYRNGMKQRIARLSRGATVLEYVGAHDNGGFQSLQLIAAFADGSLLCAHEWKRLVRVHFGSDKSEVLWPR